MGRARDELDASPRRLAGLEAWVDVSIDADVFEVADAPADDVGRLDAGFKDGAVDAGISPTLAHRTAVLRSAPNMERDLTGRCGTCSFFVTMRTLENGADEGECMLRCWPPPLRDTSTCTHHKARGSSWEGALKRKKVAGSPRGFGDEEREGPVRAPLPKEIDIDMDIDDFRNVLREVLREELGVGDVALGDRWRGGELILKPGKEGTQEKRLPLEQFFHKVVMLRDKLRVLEQKVNGSKNLEPDEKVQIQQYITGCYGSLTTFNVLFKEKDDQFVGQGGKD